MKIGFFAVGIGSMARPDLITAAATNAERLNFSTIWAPEHAALFDQYSSHYPYTTGDLPIQTDVMLLDPFLALTHAAALTKRIRLATGICLVPERSPLFLAKEAATLDYLSGGRFALGIGIGWLREEFQALGIPWEKRAKRTREYVEAMRTLWGEERSSYSGEFVKFKGARSYPKPAQGAKLPILVGGDSEAALKRAAAYGNGWCGFHANPADSAVKIKRLKEMLKNAGRGSEKFEFLVSPAENAKPDDLKHYRDAGVDEVYLAPVFEHPPETPAALVKQLEDIARQWVEPAAKM